LVALDAIPPSVPAKVVGLPPLSRSEVNAAPVRVTVVVGETKDATVSSQLTNSRYSLRRVLSAILVAKQLLDFERVLKSAAGCRPRDQRTVSRCI
jgi:hypothetical protein